VKFSLWPRSDRTPADIVEEARTADASGWYGVWLADHYMPDTGDTTPARGDTHECWALLPALAAVTERVRIGTLVSPTSVHHPALLANRAATIDRLSGGRMVLGLGAGWQINEHHAYGIALEPPGKRVSRFEEAIGIVRSLLTEDATTFHGEFYDFTDAPCDPKPVQSPLPLLVGTRGPRMQRIAARHASEWNVWGVRAGRPRPGDDADLGQCPRGPRRPGPVTGPSCPQRYGGAAGGPARAVRRSGLRRVRPARLEPG
jgi:alkanesulfonate monooxygenase SsuD/methylene tetrahydromethanopterin reductase-like flavin-dependent oxidoreductase (luciferase family)